MKFKDFHPNVKIRLLEKFISDVIGGMVYPFMAIYSAERLGSGLTGALIMINVAVGFFAGFYGGYFADIAGRKKVIAFAEVLRLAAITSMALANIPGAIPPVTAAWITMAMMMLGSICSGLSDPASTAMLIDVTPPQHRRFIYGITYWTSNLSVAVGGIVGGFFFSHYLFEIFVTLAFASLLSVILVLFFITESRPASGKSFAVKKPRLVADVAQNYKTVARDTPFMLFTLATMLVLSLEFNLTSYISVRLNDEMPAQALSLFGYTVPVNGVSILGILRTENTALVVLFAIFVNRLIDRNGEKQSFFTGLFIFTAGFLTISYSNHGWTLIVAMLVVTIGELMNVPVRQAYLADLPPTEARSSYMAMFNLVYRGAMMIAGLNITLGTFLPKEMMVFMFAATGLSGIWIYSRIMPQLDRRRSIARDESTTQSIAM
ncbi:MDR family MFS transporter [Paenibacillus allorhizosphaerae]|uniref:Na(+), Li(+), K(+)/H(+) antiporter n=1 Tax=Paenibacillus allorhizosphaerae TaxID=2849866 RepID=A0ABM8VD50_9BACL|nr:MFS transporter [Paenibacillus allorhizosphaerae]CAG7626598.1 Na(+), Li(+), K(+)/H(+) antiporter [Paenibacillus allorhizosphaerae]